MSNKLFNSFKAFREFFVYREDIQDLSTFERVWHHSKTAAYFASYMKKNGKVAVSIFWTNYGDLNECEFDTYAQLDAYVADMMRG